MTAHVGHMVYATPSVVEPVSSAIWNVCEPPIVTAAVYSLGTQTERGIAVRPRIGKREGDMASADVVFASFALLASRSVELARPESCDGALASGNTSSGSAASSAASEPREATSPHPASGAARRRAEHGPKTEPRWRRRRLRRWSMAGA